jgi:hypothetical protein
MRALVKRRSSLKPSSLFKMSLKIRTGSSVQGVYRRAMPTSSRRVCKIGVRWKATRWRTEE